jgi:hypothetical protein
VVELEMKIHRYEKADLDPLEVDPAHDPYEDYYTALNDKVLPDQKALTDAQKVKEGRFLHVQIDNNHGRAKAVLQKLVADQWPAGTDDYYITVGQENASGTLKIFDKDFEGAEKATDDDKRIKVKDLKAKEWEVWLEGGSETDKLREIVLDLGLNREPGGLAKEPKRNADWSRFTVIKIEEVKLDYTPEPGKAVAWDAGTKRFHINLKEETASHDGRKVTIAAKLTKKIEGVPLYFMLAPHENNRKAANWGKDIPGTWKWKDIEEGVKHKDRDTIKKLLHLSEKTNADGAAKKELILSRFGGDVFQPGCYIEQDPHLAKYMPAHDTLKKRKPVLAADSITVWRKFWYHEVKVTGLNVAGFGNAPNTYDDVKTVMEAATAVEMPRATANAISPRVIYPKHMVSYYVNAARTAYLNNYPNDASDALVVGDGNRDKFFALISPAADKPVKIPIMNAHALWIPDGATTSLTMTTYEEAFPFTLTADKQLLDPPLQGGTLLAGGTWVAYDWDAVGANWVNRRTGVLAAADVSLDPARTSGFQFRINQPAGLVMAARTRLRVNALTLRAATSFLGTSYTDGIVNSYTPNDLVDFINTINHEIGHSLKQVTKVQPAGIPAHPNQYDKDGSHCNYTNNSCLMYESGPTPVHLDRYCPVCHPYVLVQDMSKL